MASKLDQYKDAIYAAVTAGETLDFIATNVVGNTSGDYVGQWLRKQPDAPSRPSAATSAPPNLLETVSREEILEAEIRELRSQHRASRSLQVQEQRLLEAVEAAVDRTPSLLPAPAAKVIDSDDVGHTLMLLLSDTHAGEIVDAEAMGGFDEYNWDIMEQRMVSMANAIVSHQQHNTDPVRKLVIAGLGDMLSGQNHEELDVTNEFPIADQTWMFAHTLDQFVRMLVPYFEEIEVLGVPGNHPRIRKQPANKQVFNNFDWLMYKTAGLLLADVPSVTTRFTKAGFLLHEVAGNTFYIWHGDGIRTSMPGVPWGGVMRRVNTIAKKWARKGVIIDHFALGHFHQANAVQNIFMNGSVKGPDEYVDKNFGDGEPPRQLLIEFSNKRERVTGVRYLDL